MARGSFSKIEHSGSMPTTIFRLGKLKSRNIFLEIIAFADYAVYS